MRDFNTDGGITVHGDFNITDNSSQGKLLVNCSNAELVAERTHRTAVLKAARASKLNKLVIFWGVILGIVGGVSFYLFLDNNKDLAGYVLTLGGLIGTLVPLKFYNDPTEFETRQLEYLKEIEMLLRERGAE